MNTPGFTYDLEEVRRMLNHTKVGLVVSVSSRRIGGLSFMTFLEHRVFPPGTPHNQFFTMVLIDWLHMRFMVAIIPKRRLPEADALAKTLGLRRADGVPRCIHANAAADVVASTRDRKIVVDSFPLDQDNVFTMENVKGHFAYRNNPAENKTAQDYEDEAVEREIAAFNAKAPAILMPSGKGR